MKIQPCPECGDKFPMIQVEHAVESSNDKYKVYCLNCSTCGDAFTSKDQAKDYWNKSVSGGQETLTKQIKRIADTLLQREKDSDRENPLVTYMVDSENSRITITIDL